MNIKDVEVPVESIPDCLLTDIFRRQQELLDKYRDIEGLPDLPIDIDTKEGQRILKDFKWRIVEELGEAANCLKNKPWKQTHILTDRDHYLEELIDAFHFFIELFIVLDLSPQDVWALYFKKQEVNKFRQRSQY